MKLKNLFYILAIIFLTSPGCGGAESVKTANSGIMIRLSADSSMVELYNIPLNIAEELQADSMQYDQWTDFFAVYPDTTDQDMRDFLPALDGTYTLKDSLVQFAPANAFVKGKPYFARCYTKDVLEEAQDLISKRELSTNNEFMEFLFTIK